MMIEFFPYLSDDENLFPVSNMTYKYFAKQYGIRLYHKRCCGVKPNNTKNKFIYRYTKKDYKTLRNEIKQFEENNDIKDGLYF